jgi:hypothetical protein
LLENVLQGSSSSTTSYGTCCVTGIDHAFSFCAASYIGEARWRRKEARAKNQAYDTAADATTIKMRSKRLRYTSLAPLLSWLQLY